MSGLAGRWNSSNGSSGRVSLLSIQSHTGHSKWRLFTIKRRSPQARGFPEHLFRAQKTFRPTAPPENMVPKITPTPRSSLRVSKHQIPAWHNIPNTSIKHKPLLIYHSAFPATASASAIEAALSAAGAVVPQWRYTMYSTTHFHSTTHEVLAISQGKARLCFGGEGNEGRIEPVVSKGDVVVVPAGVGHRLVEDVEGGFEMVGSYPQGCHWDMCYGKGGEERQVEGIKGLRWLERDPVYGGAGPAVDDV